MEIEKNKKKPFKRKTGKKFSLFQNGRMISKQKYWHIKLNSVIAENKEYSMNIKFNATETKKIMILLKIWDEDSPSSLIKHLLNEHIAVLNSKELIKKLSKKQNND